MKLLSVVATVATMMVALVALTAPAQVTAGPQAPAQTPAAQPPQPAAQPPQPAAQPPPPTPPPARLPFPPDATHAYIDLARVAAESLDGQAANQMVQALSEQKVQVLEGRTVELQASQEKLQQNANVMSAEAQLQLQREIERLSIDIQRMTQDAENEVAELQQTLQLEFQQKLVPAIDRVAASKGLRFIFSAGNGGLIWAAPAFDITADVVAELDKASQPTP
jgi:outer membrane protein